MNAHFPPKSPNSRKSSFGNFYRRSQSEATFYRGSSKAPVQQTNYGYSNHFTFTNNDYEHTKKGNGKGLASLLSSRLFTIILRTVLVAIVVYAYYIHCRLKEGLSQLSKKQNELDMINDSLAWKREKLQGIEEKFLELQSRLNLIDFGDHDKHDIIQSVTLRYDTQDERRRALEKSIQEMHQRDLERR